MTVQLIQERPRPTSAAIPEPADLYFLAVMAFQLHVPDEAGDALLNVCGLCREPWPCPQVRLAFRNREAF